VNFRITLVGPVFPLTGGIAQHNSRLAQELERHGPQVEVESWRHQYPRWLHRGQQESESPQSEVGLPNSVRRELTWYSPLSWWRAGWASRFSDVLLLSIPTAFHVIPYSIIRFAARPRRTIGVVHNVTPHEQRLGSTMLMKLLLNLCDELIVHSEEAAEQVKSLVKSKVSISTLKLPSPWQMRKLSRVNQRAEGAVPRFLFFGTVRPYKGLDLLLEALSQVPRCELIVAGDFWEPVARYQQLITELGLDTRVELRPGYVEVGSLEEVFSRCDALVLPYRSGTGSIVRELGFSFGLPALATRVGSIAETIVDGENGLIVEPQSVEALVEGLQKLCDDAQLKRLKKGVAKLSSDSDAEWERYCRGIIG
jgi:glycosyltransferase involved in cell wall biosynthesis